MPGNYQSGVLDPLNQTSFDNSQAGVNQTQNPVLLVGQVLVAQPQVITPMFSVAQCSAFCGRGSHLDRLFQAYFANDQIGPIYILPFADAVGAAAATGLIVFSGPVSAPGVWPLYIAGTPVPIAAAMGDNATATVLKFVAAINANPDLPVTASVPSNPTHLLLTARNLGSLGNAIDIRFAYLGLSNNEALPAGTTAAVTMMSGGTLDPDMTQVAPILGDTPMRLVVHSYTGSAAMAAFAALMNFITGRWAPLRKSWGHCFTALAGLPAALSTFGATNNDPHSSVFAYEDGSPTPPWEASGAWAGSMAGSLRQQPNRPVQTLPIAFFKAPQASMSEAQGGAFLKTTRNVLEGQGLGVARYDGGMPAISRAPTTYQLNAYGAPDQSYFDTEDMFLLMALADRINAFETQGYARSLIADDGTKFAPGLPITTPSLFKAAMISVYTQAEFDGLVEDASSFISASLAWRNTASPSELDVLWAPYLVVGLRQITNTVQFRKYSAAAAAAAIAA